MDRNAQGISRRDLLRGAGISAAGVAALGMIGCSPSAPADTNAADGSAAGEKHTWEVAPEPITDIASTVDTEVLVIGAGYSGTCCALSAAENGTKVILVEKDNVPNGHGVGGTGAVGSKYLTELGIVVDKPLEMQRWVSTCGNRCRESLVGKWFRESERCMNWLIDLAEDDGCDVMVTVGSNSVVHPEVDCYHMIYGGQTAADVASIATYIEYLFIDRAEKTGNFEIVYNSPAVQLVTDDSGAVTGAICETDEGYVLYNASKGVVLATGDISYNDEYIDYFAPVANKVMTRLCSDQGNTGDGHNMAAWVGGAFQDAPWPTMMHPQAAGMFSGPFLFINPDGKRFMNEATWVQGKCVGTMINGGYDHCWSIFDGGWEADNTASLEFGGGMFWDSFRPVGSTAADATASHAEAIEAGITDNPDNYKKADTLDELLAQLDVDVETAKATIERYNELCTAGEDVDFYKESHYLFGVEEGPFYAVKLGPGLLCVPGGIHISDDFEVLTAEDQPVAGLYAIGNCAGDIYAYDYPINIQGNSHGRCLVEGKCLGEQLAGVYESVKA
ncbi:Fumarate reductase flavoprotein subunit precursor [Slackia heliotrinireducens]|uniref:Succinate dehydrogenase/fumarate reductase flavoprotein subunit n=1 Tax=Slackia heliotrinireducens (strain ATCC 29202 / DSM 20476 / NCTC 11029 / RHS 1) TaxID=471855 RepID=C7N2C8_SLAHD|nr:FAD-dependent oxidoreductase [Slackia heliotrinireducens]ACV21434.1 succinate dehydrogenase/fumarate reductase flavoprotein subunit [Slackia heliotrinireducens DSM 20476]VEG98872.1 Fumarate reductase flavoprotein subunit precursor [Slackia heliotrinireducens]